MIRDIAIHYSHNVSTCMYFVKIGAEPNLFRLGFPLGKTRFDNYVHNTSHSSTRRANETEKKLISK